MSGQTAGNLPAACGVKAATSSGNAWKRARKIQHWLAAIVSWQEVENHIHPTTEAAATQRRRCVRGKFRGHPSQILEGHSPPNTSHQACPSRRLYKARQTKLSKAIHARLQRKLQQPWTSQEFRLHRNGRKQVSKHQLKL
jgi:hypothetical protein